MRVVTTVHKAGFDLYGDRFITGMNHWPKHELRMYSEGFDNPTGFHVEQLEGLVKFKDRHKHYRPNSWQWDVIRFSNKVYSMYDAAKDYDGLIVWLDCDCVTYADLPDQYIENLLPKDHFLAYFRRVGIHSELGFWIMDGSHPEKQSFLDTWLQWYEKDLFKDLRQWHDCETFDATVRLFVRRDRFKVHSLSGKYEKDMHPMAKADIGKYIDHQKGSRKSLSKSPENVYRDATGAEVDWTLQTR